MKEAEEHDDANASAVERKEPTCLVKWFTLNGICIAAVHKGVENQWWELSASENLSNQRIRAGTHISRKRDTEQLVFE